jgi:hypothetical protein
MGDSGIAKPFLEITGMYLFFQQKWEILTDKTTGNRFILKDLRNVKEEATNREILYLREALNKFFNQ